VYKRQFLDEESSARDEICGIPVQQFDSNGDIVATYGSLSSAVSESGVERQFILSVLNGDMDDWNGIRWCYQNLTPKSESGIMIPREPEPEVLLRPRVSTDGNSDTITDRCDSADNSSVADERLPNTPTKAIIQNSSTVSSRELCTAPACSPLRCSAIEKREALIKTDGFVLLQICVEDHGPLGINVTEGMAPSALMDILQRDHHLDVSESRSSLSMFVSSFKSTNAPAKKAGIQVDDWLFLKGETSGTILTKYSDVRSAVAKGTRPLCFVVGRLTNLSLIHISEPTRPY